MQNSNRITRIEKTAKNMKKKSQWDTVERKEQQINRRKARVNRNHHDIAASRCKLS